MKFQEISNYYSKYVWPRPRHDFFEFISKVKEVNFIKKSLLNTESTAVILKQQRSST